MSEMSSARLLSGIISARKAAADTLLRALNKIEPEYSEAHLRDQWLNEISKNDSVFPFGWYQPPPNGISVLIGNPDTYERLKYRSLRDEVNFPNSDILYGNNSVIYPYFSSIHKETLMIGDHVATYYKGENNYIRDWLTKAYGITNKIAQYASVGMTYSDIYKYSIGLFKQNGVYNNTFSQSAGFSSDIGHTIPFFEMLNAVDTNIIGNASQGDLSKIISQGRYFINENNNMDITRDSAFTIEPQLIHDGLPLASFHLIIAFSDGIKHIITEFDKIFDHFGMTNWISRDCTNFS